MAEPSVFNRLILPGFAFKAVVIGGGYATGRELVEFFFDSGPRGGLYGLGLTALIWSVVCTATFLVARALDAYDYRSFFKGLLGRGWPLFEVAYILLMLLVLSVFGAAAGEIFRTAFGLPAFAGTLCLMLAIITVTAAGREAMEQMFKYVSIFLYAVYAIFIVLVVTKFGDKIAANLALPTPTDGWARSGLTYASYNLVGAIVILPMARHIRSSRDAVVAGMLCGPFAALPALLFFLCLIAFYPAIGAAALPSDVMLSAIGAPIFHMIFQGMILCALLESGGGLVHALNERVAGAMTSSGRRMTTPMRLAVSSVIVVTAMVVAARVGLIDLIAKGYGVSAYVFLAIYIVPLLTLGVLILVRQRRRAAAA